MADGPEDTLDPEDVTEAEARAIFGSGRPEDRPQYMQERTVDEIPDRSTPDGPEDTLDPEDVTEPEAEAIFDSETDSVTFRERLPEDVRQGRRQPTAGELERARRHHGAAEFGVPAEDVVVENDGTVRVSEAGQFRRAARELDVDPGALERQGGEIRLREDVARRRVAESVDYAEPEDVVVDREAGQATVSEAARERHAREQIAADLPGVEPDEVVLEDYESPVDPDLRPLPERALPEQVADLTPEGADDLADQQAAQAEREIAAERGIDPERVTVDPETGEVDVAAKYPYQRGLNRLNDAWRSHVDTLSDSLWPFDHQLDSPRYPGAPHDATTLARTVEVTGEVANVPAALSDIDTLTRFGVQRARSAHQLRVEAANDYVQEAPDPLKDPTGNLAAQADFAGDVARSFSPVRSREEAETAAAVGAAAAASGGQSAYHELAHPDGLDRLYGTVFGAAAGSLALGTGAVRAARLGRSALQKSSRLGQNALQRYSRLGDDMTMFAGLPSRAGREATEKVTDAADDLAPLDRLSTTTRRQTTEEATDAADEAARTRQRILSGERVDFDARTRPGGTVGADRGSAIDQFFARRSGARGPSSERLPPDQPSKPPGFPETPDPRFSFNQPSNPLAGGTDASPATGLEAAATRSLTGGGAGSLDPLADEATERVERAQRSEVLASAEDPTGWSGSALAPLADRATGGGGPRQLVEEVQDRANRQLFDLREQADTRTGTDPATAVSEHLDRLTGQGGRERQASRSRQSAQTRQSLGERLAALSRAATDQATRQATRQVPTAATATPTTPTPGTPRSPPGRIPWPRPDIGLNSRQDDDEGRSLEDLVSHYWSRPVADASDVLGDMTDLSWLQ